MENTFNIDWREFEWEWIRCHSGHSHSLFDTTLAPGAELCAPIHSLQECPEAEQSGIHYPDIDRLLNDDTDSIWCQYMSQLDEINGEWKRFEDAIMEEDHISADGQREEPEAAVSDHSVETITRDQYLNTAAVQSGNGSYNSICTEDLFHHEEHKGLRIVHLLIACAEAFAGDAMDLGHVIIDRLRGLVCASGSSMERVGYYLYHTLRSYAVGYTELQDLGVLHSAEYKAVLLGAFRVLFEVYPYIRFAHFVANHFILETLIKEEEKGNAKKIHIIDFDIMEGLQWPPLMEELIHHVGTPLRLRITALKWTDVDSGSISSTEDTARRLSKLAASLEGIESFVFRQVQLEDVESHVRGDDEDESVIINCMWELPHMTSPRRISHLSRFLHCAGKLRPVILTLADGAFQNSGNLAPDLAVRLCESLYHFGAVFDSLEARLPRQELATALVERIYFCSKIQSSLLTIPPTCHDDVSPSHVIVELGFVKNSGLAHLGLLHARGLLQTYDDSGSGLYTVDLVNDELVLKWGLTSLVRTSMWELKLQL